MTFYRETVRAAPASIAIPPELQNRAIEIIILPLDEPAIEPATAQTDANGYPLGFFERTFGAVPDFPEREAQPPFDLRESFE